MRKFIVTTLVLSVAISFGQTRKTENVILITLDGFRWQEVFNGADSSMFGQQKNLKDRKLKDKYWRDNPDDRRKALLPFFWNTIALQDSCMETGRKGARRM